jgi:hypothetical protein
MANFTQGSSDIARLPAYNRPGYLIAAPRVPNLIEALQTDFPSLY